MKSTLKIPRRTGTYNKTDLLARRLAYIIASLHQGEKIDKHALAQRFNVGVRTIERDLGERLIDIAHNPKGEGWTLLPHARSTIPANTLGKYAEMVGTTKLFPEDSAADLLRRLDTPAAQRPFEVQSIPREDLPRHDQRFNQLEQACAQRCECHFFYKDKPRQAQPYRLLNKNGIWYLAAVEGQRLKNFSVARIESLRVDANAHFEHQQKHLDYIANKKDVWFTTETTEVLLRVTPEAAHYFARRELLPGQQTRQDGDQSLLVTAHISHPNQLLPLVRYWLPHVRILKPLHWHEALVGSLHDALQRWGESPATQPALKQL